MQNTLRQNARQFQYSTDDDQEDGVRVILDGLHREAVDMERRGVCGYDVSMAHAQEDNEV